VQRFAADRNWNRQVWHIAWASSTFLQRQGRPHDLYQSWQLGVAAAERLGDYELRVHAHVYRAEAAARLRDFTQADRDLGAALALTIEHDDRVRQSDVHWTLARNWSRRQRDDLALEYATRALRLVDDPEHLNERIRLTNAVGWYAALTGRYAEAHAHLETALELARRHHRPLTEAHALDSLGFLALRSGEPARAQQLLTQSLRLARDNGDAVSEANVLEHLGDAGAALHDETAARNRWSMAAQLYQEQHRKDEAETVERKISLLDRRPARPVPVLVRRRRAARV
jgi:tetratricopeptide (TPR) repeat protein